ncbi:MAG: CHAT domain-containing protein, partial [Symploca sp. SIO2B6]|nr:CHAT domain-containing protein [Symploca sp. SIO2B6]
QTAIALRSLGDALRFVGDLNQSRTALTSSLAMAQQLQREDLVHTAQLSLANTLQAQEDDDSALILYRTLAQTASQEIQVQALSNQFTVLMNRGQVADARALWSTLQTQFSSLSPSQPALFARITVIQQLIRLGVANTPSRSEQAEQLAIAIQQAQAIGDVRSESYGIGTLGLLYETTGQWGEAQSLSEQALTLAQSMNATDIGYLWQWQLGRIYKALGDRARTPQLKQQHFQKATSAYSDAVDSLQQLRTDLVAVNAQVQVSFQDSVEPIHRELVSLLLDPTRNDTTPDDIEKARIVIESLQLAELDNFFREACLDTESVDIDQLDAKAAVVYPIMLRDRLEVVVSFPNHDLKHYTTPVPRETVETLVDQLRQHLTLRISNRFRPGMARMYDWLIRPMLPDLDANQVETLVFVLDGALRNIPMAALYDSGAKTFLVESFSIAVTPGLQLVNPQPIQEQNLAVLTGALSEARQGFSALPNVVPEVEQIQSTVPAQVLLNEEFTEESFQSALQSNAEPIVHLATHGKFSSNKDETFLLTWDGQLSINALNDVLQVSTLNQSGPIELLVLSACQTATGDKEAALGLAGMAVRAGARSTVATLWQVNDEATALLMEQLYEELSSRQVSKAEALRQAQLRILHDPQFRNHPYYWAPFILVGNWL